MLMLSKYVKIVFYTFFSLSYIFVTLHLHERKIVLPILPSLPGYLVVSNVLILCLLLLLAG